MPVGPEDGPEQGEAAPDTWLPPPDRLGEAAGRSSQTAILLMLKDGSMYGLADYWLDGGRLHYITNYGGENSVELDRVDLPATLELNSRQGTPFLLRERQASH